MTNGSCHSRCESNVHACVKPSNSACFVSSTTRHAGGFVCNTTPMSMRLRPPALDHSCDACVDTGPPDLRLAFHVGPQRVRGKPRSTAEGDGSGQRDVTTFVRV